MPHQLEIDILLLLQADKLNTVKIKELLDEMQKEEIYLTVRDNHGRTPDTILWEKGLGLMATHIPFSYHNEHIDNKKTQRLQPYISLIEKNNLIDFQQALIQIDNTADLSYLLSITIEENKKDMAAFLIQEKNVDVNLPGKGAKLPLYLAVEKNNNAILELLSVHGCNFLLPDVGHTSPLFSVWGINAPLLHYLIEKGCDINTQDYDNRHTLLHKAVFSGNIELAKLVLTYGIQLERLNRYSQTAYRISIDGFLGNDFYLNSPYTQSHEKTKVANGRRAIQLLIIEEQRERQRLARIFKAIAEEEKSEVHLAHFDIADKDIPSIINVLSHRQVNYFLIDLTGNPGITKKGTKTLIDFLAEKSSVMDLAIEEEKIEKEWLDSLSAKPRLKQLLENYTKLTQEPLELVKKITEKDKSILGKLSEEGWYLIHFSSYCNHWNIVEHLVKNSETMTKSTEEEGGAQLALHLAAEKGCTQVLEILLVNGFSPDRENGTKQTALEIAVQKQDIESVGLLLKYGANPNYCFVGKTLLELACELKCIDIVQMLLNAGSLVPVKLLSLVASQDLQKILLSRKEAELSLCQAAKQNLSDEVKTLILEKQININSSDDNGNTALHYALEAKNWVLAAWLLYHGAHYGTVDALNNLKQSEEDELRSQLALLRERNPQATLYFFNAITNFASKPKKDNYDVYQMYKEIYGGESNYFEKYTRVLLEIAEGERELTITFDPNSQNTRRANLSTCESTRGNYSPDKKQIQIAGNANSYEEVRGTLTHEICHLVCGRVWQNERNPFFLSTPEEKQFKAIVSRLKEDESKSLPLLIKQVFGGGMDMNNYIEEKYCREIIVRIPQIIATYGLEYCTQLCKKNQNFKDLFDYYSGYFLKTCYEYLDLQLKIQTNSAQNEQFFVPLPVHQRMQQLSTINREYTVEEKKAVKKIEKFWIKTLQKRTYHNLQNINTFFKSQVKRFTDMDCQQTANVLQIESREKLNKLIDIAGENCFEAYQESNLLLSKMRKSN